MGRFGGGQWAGPAVSGALRGTGSSNSQTGGPESHRSSLCPPWASGLRTAASQRHKHKPLPSASGLGVQVCGGVSLCVFWGCIVYVKNSMM